MPRGICTNRSSDIINSFSYFSVMEYCTTRGNCRSPKAAEIWQYLIMQCTCCISNGMNGKIVYVIIIITVVTVYPICLSILCIYGATTLIVSLCVRLSNS